MHSAPTRLTSSPPQSPPQPAWARDARRGRRARIRLFGAGVSKHTVLIALSAMFALPLVWMVGTSVKTAGQALQLPVVWWPHPFVWSNYPDLFASLPYFRFFWNTFLYAAITIVGVLISSSLVAYGFSRLRWPGRDGLFYVMLMTLILPFACTLIPLFVMYKNFGWIGTYLPLEVPTFFGSSVFSTFLLRQFFMTIPQSLSEAARIDGANEFYIYSRIIMPLAKPALASVILFQFVYCWNDYLGPLVYLRDPEIQTIQLGLRRFIDAYNAEYALIMTGSVLSVLPIAIVFMLGQRYFIEGVATTGLKG